MKKLEEELNPDVHYLEHFIYQGTLAVPTEIDEKIRERTEIRSSVTFALIGETRMEEGTLMSVVTDFWEIHSLEEVQKISEKYHLIAMLYKRTLNSSVFSNDLLTTIISVELIHPALHIIVGPGSKKLILSFEKCRRCKHSFLRLFADKKPEWR